MGFTQEIKSLIIGLDVGQKVDRTVLVLLEKCQEYGHDIFIGKNPVGKPYYIMKYMERFPLDIPTPQQVDRVKLTYDQIIKKYNKDLPDGKSKMKPTLIIDMGNVGRAHFDEYQQTGLNVYGINYLGDGAKSDRSPDRGVYGVSKKDLASALSILLENNRLQIPENIPDRKHIIKELSKFTWKQTAAGNITVENLKSSDHDDIVCSLMGAAWFGEYGQREMIPMTRPPGL
jgi:hypothetical protein